jgi:hypothetical protein
MRKPNPERIYQARRAANFRRLVLQHRLDELDAEHWIAAWEREAASCGPERHGGAFWEEGQAWIADGRRGSKPGEPV